MKCNEFGQKFGACQRLYGHHIIKKLQHSHIMVVGLGGVGSWAAEALARTGVGQLSLIDLDEICITNINRQVHTLSHVVGQSKVQVMADRIQAINAHCRVNCIVDFLLESNIDQLIDPDADYIIDAIDDYRIKSALIVYCREKKIRLITIGSAGGKTDPTQITMNDLGWTTHDPLARKMKTCLKKQYGWSTDKRRRFLVDCVFSSETIRYPQADQSVGLVKPKDRNLRLNCGAGLGSSTMVTATFAFVAVAHIMRQFSQ